MWSVVRNRLLWFPLLLVIVTFAVFVLIDLAPGDPARSIAGPDASEQAVDRVRESLDLDDPLMVRYLSWAGRAVQGDLGHSFVTRKPVMASILDGLPVTLSLVISALALAVSVALPLGALAAFRPNGTVDRVIVGISSVAISVPTIVLAMLLIVYLSLDLGLFPAVGYVSLTADATGWIRHMAIPAMSVAALLTGELLRHVRGSLVEVLSRDYIVAARARGVPSASIVFKHGLKNAAIPVVTVLGLRVTQMLGFAAVVEPIFLLRGVGHLSTTAAITRDVPVIIGIVAISAVLVLILNLLVDISYGYLNPRLRS